MSKKDPNKTSTTDIFLNFISRQKEDEKETNSQDDPNLFINGAFKHGLQAINFINGMLDKMLSTKTAIRVLSFVITILIVFMLNGGSVDNVFSTPTSGDVISDVPVEVTGLSKDYVISGLVDHVEVMVIGSSLDIYALKAMNDYYVYIDATNLGEGEQTVELKTANFSDSLTVVVVPSSIVVKIESKVTQTFPLSYRFINEDDLQVDESVALTAIDLETIEVRGSQEDIDSIVSVEANIDVSNASSEFNQEASIVAYDGNGDIVEVEFGSDTVYVECRLDTYSKVVPLVVRVQGTVAENMAVEDIVLSQTEVTLYGSESLLEDVTSAYVYVDVSDLEEDTTRTAVSIRAIEGVNKMSIASVDAIVTIGELETGSLKDVDVSVLNLAEGYTLTGDLTVDVSFSGASSVVSSLEASNLQLSIDVSDLTTGEHEVTLKLESSETYVTFTTVTNLTVEIKEQEN